MTDDELRTEVVAHPDMLIYIKRDPELARWVVVVADPSDSTNTQLHPWALSALAAVASNLTEVVNGKALEIATKAMKDGVEAFDYLKKKPAGEVPS
jgi:hypothetical protein